MSNNLKEIEGFIGEKGEKFQYIRLPYFLLGLPRFKQLSAEAVLLYALLLDRVSISQKNRWLEADGRVFIYFSQEKACEILGMSRYVIGKAMGELDSKKGVGLIARKRQGLGKPDKIYLYQVAPLEQEFLSKKKEVMDQVNKRNPGELLQTFQLEGVFSTELQEIDASLLKKEGKSEIKKREFQASSCKKMKGLEEQKSGSSQPDKNQTEKNHRNLSQSSPSSPSTGSEHKKNPLEIQGSKDKKLGNDWHSLAYSRLEQGLQRGKSELLQVFCDFREDREKLGALTGLLTEQGRLDKSMAGADSYSREMLFASAEKLYTEALTELLFSQKNLTLKGEVVTPAQFLNKLLPHVQRNRHDSNQITLGELPSCTVELFLAANQVQEIRSPLAYMKTCVWTGLKEGIVKAELGFHHHFG